MPRSYFVYRPASAAAAAPTVLLLHGAGRDGRSMIEMWRDTADKHGLLLLGLNATGNQWSAKEAAAVQTLIEISPERHGSDPSQVFLFGHSAGAAFAQLLTNRYDGPWVAMATHAGYAEGIEIVPRSNGEPIRAYLGSSDHIFNPAMARQIGQSLADNGHRFELVMIPNHNHWFYEIGPKIAEDTWLWFKSKLG